MAGFCSQAERRRDDRDGDIKRLNLPLLDRQQLRDMIYSIMTDTQVKNFEEHWEADFSTEVKGIARFQVNVFN